MGRPVVGIATDLSEGSCRLRHEYLQLLADAGGLPVLLPPVPEAVPDLVARCDAVVLTGGDDPDMTAFGAENHPRARLVDPRRQQAELVLLEVLAERHAELPVLGICFGMQLMGLHAGGALHQHLPDVLPDAGRHEDDRLHAVEGEVGRGDVTSRHHQALSGAGRLRVVARASDGVIEAVSDPDRPFYLGVQWHPERTRDPDLGAGVLRRLVAAAR